MIENAMREIELQLNKSEKERIKLRVIIMKWKLVVHTGTRSVKPSEKVAPELADQGIHGDERVGYK